MINMHLDQIAGMLDQAADQISEFRKETYATSFERHLEENVSVWCALAAVWNEDTPDREQVYIQVADCLTDKVQRMQECIKGRTKREELQLNMNLYMVSYFLPSIIASSCPKEFDIFFTTTEDAKYKAVYISKDQSSILVGNP